MARRGRKPTGVDLLEGLEGSEHAKARARAILETLSGHITIPDACDDLDLGETMFHKMRKGAIQILVTSLEPRPLGRPPRHPPRADLRVAALETENQQLRVALTASEVRRELAETLPRLAHPAEPPGKKTTPSHCQQRQHRRRRKRPGKKP
jgi:hypothetical protein